MAEQVNTSFDEEKVIGEFNEQTEELEEEEAEAEELADDEHDDQLKELQDTEFGDDQWVAMFHLLKEFQTETGQDGPPPELTFRGKRLGDWALTQRRRHNILSAAGFKWDEENSCIHENGSETTATALEASQKDDEDGEEWEANFELLKTYKDQMGHCNPQKRETFAEKRLGLWVALQRAALADGDMSANRMVKLDSIGFCWSEAEANRLLETDKSKNGGKATSNDNDDMLEDEEGVNSWEEMFSLLKAYGEDKKHVYPHQKEVYHGKELGAWVHKQRTYRRLREAGKMDSGLISGERIAKLDEIGFAWGLGDLLESVETGTVNSNDDGDNDGEDSRGREWLIMLDLLKEYQQEHNHVTPHQKEQYRGKNLGLWVSNQRASRRQRDRGQLKASSTSMSDERIAKLDEIGFVWEPKHHKKRRKTEELEASPRMMEKKSTEQTQETRGRNGQRSGKEWDDMYQLLCEWREENGHSSPNQKEIFRCRNLGLWVSNQRAARRQRDSGRLKETSTAMSDERIAKLDEIDFCWDASSRRGKRKKSENNDVEEHASLE